jgi:ACS family tartrate transporter-like MFS transporter
LTMNAELGIGSEQFGILAGVFFFGYYIFEIPSNLLMQKIGARVWIARILITWGAVATLTGFVQSVHQLYAVRFFLGLAEAGYFPGMVLYLTYWFPRREQAVAIALLLTGSPATTILGGPLSGFILDHAHWLGLNSWRWLLILEGMPAILCGFLTYYLLPNRPGEAKFLNEEEKEWIRVELESEESKKLTERQYSVMDALTSGRVWHLTAVYFGLMFGGYIFTFWTPQLVKSVSAGYSNTAIGFLIMIPNLAGLAAMIVISRNSDRRLERRYHVAIPAALGALALALLSLTHTLVFSVALLCVLAIGAVGFLGPFWAMPSEFLTGRPAAAGIALVNSVGNLAGFAGPYALGAMSQRTGSLSRGLAFASIPLLLSALLVVMLRREEKAGPRN